MEKNYVVEIANASKNLKLSEKLVVKDFQDAVDINKMVDGNEYIDIIPDFYCELKVHNEHSKLQKDYTKLVIMGSDGTKYVTGSKTFRETFFNIMDDVNEALQEEEFDYCIRCFSKPSKNFADKCFYTCSLILE